MNNKKIDIYLNVIDNLWDMGFVAEFLYFFQENFWEKYQFDVHTNDTETLLWFFRLNKLEKYVKIFDINNQKNHSKIAISFFHTKLPYEIYEKTLRIDYLSFDDIWLKNNLGQHIFSSPKNQIIEFIPSPKKSWAGLLPKISTHHSKEFFVKKFGFGDISKKWFSCFCYADSLKKIDFQNMPNDVEVFLFGANHLNENLWKNIYKMPFMHFTNFYNFLETSDYIITRGEVSFSQVLQMGKPFLWDMYHELGGFPHEQSEDFLNFIKAHEEYKEFIKNFWHKDTKISIQETINILEKSKSLFQKQKYNNLCMEIKNFLDNSENFI